MKKILSSYRSFEQSIQALHEKAKQGPVPLKTLLRITSGKGKILLLIFLSLIFGQIPGLSLFLGIFIVYIGARVLFNGHWIWLPSFSLQKKIPSRALLKATEQILRFLKLIKRGTDRRYLWVSTALVHSINGLLIVVIGIFFCLSPPVPLIAYLAISALFLLGMGLLNEDGLYVILGYVLALAYIFAVMICLKYFSITAVIEYVKGLVQ